MLVKAFIALLQLTAVARAIPGFTTAGTHFVVAIPPCQEEIDGADEEVTIHLSTLKLQASVVISSLPIANSGTNNTGREDKIVLVPKFKGVSVKVGLGHDIGSKTDANKMEVIVIKASALVRAFVSFVCGTVLETGDVFELIPQLSCSTSYYVTALTGFPYVLVAAFDKPTNIRVRFPASPEMFRMDCGADKQCTPNSEVSVQLESYTAWYFQVKTIGSDLHNTFIEADSPVFVVSGNSICRNNDVFGDGVSTCATSCKPKVAWGKAYVVPYFGATSEALNTILLRLNAEKFPFKFSFLNKSGTHRQRARNVLENLVYNVDSVVVISAEVPFGLSLFYCALHDGSIKDDCFIFFTSLVPTEQWVNSAVHISDYMVQYLRKHTRTLIIISEGKAPLQDYKDDVVWEELMFEKKFYSFAKLDSNSLESRILTKSPSVRLIVYEIFGQGESKFCGLHALDFYQGKIYSPDCMSVKSVHSDGIDNDCDGSVDEENDDGKDDDGDGRIDEDTVVEPGQSAWTGWGARCEIKSCRQTQNQTIIREVRDCKLSLTSGMCEGEETRCSPGPTCPVYCNDNKLEEMCPCPDNCARCDVKTGTCTLCKPGFFGSRFCLERCPNAWDGTDCEQGPVTPEDFAAIFEEEEEEDKVEEKKSLEMHFNWESTIKNFQHDVENGERKMVARGKDVNISQSRLRRMKSVKRKRDNNSNNNSGNSNISERSGSQSEGNLKPPAQGMTLLEENVAILDAAKGVPKKNVSIWKREKTSSSSFMPYFFFMLIPFNLLLLALFLFVRCQPRTIHVEVNYEEYENFPADNISTSV